MLQHDLGRISPFAPECVLTSACAGRRVVRKSGRPLLDIVALCPRAGTLAVVRDRLQADALGRVKARRMQRRFFQCCCSLERAIDLFLLYIREDAIVIALPVLVVRVDLSDVALLARWVLVPAADLQSLVVCHLYQSVRGIGEIERLHPPRRMAVSFLSLEVLGSNPDATSAMILCPRWRMVCRGEPASECLHRHVLILRKREVVSRNGVVIATDDVLTRCLGVGCIEERWIKLQNFAIVIDGLFVVLFLFRKLCPHVKCNCVLIDSVYLLCHKALYFGVFTSSQEPMEHGPPAARS